MIDTIHFESEWRLVGTHPDWDIKVTKTRSGEDGAETVGKLSITHRHLKIKINGMEGSASSGIVRYFKIPSLGTLLHGHNAIPLNGQPEIDAALAVLDRLLRQILEPVKSKSERRFTRVDMSLNLLNLSFPAMEPVLQRANLPRSREAPRHYLGESMTYYRNYTELQIYDKTKRSAATGLVVPDTLPSVVRIELRLLRDDLEREFKCRRGKGVQELNILECYRVFRDHVLSLTQVNGKPLAEVKGVTNLNSFLAYLAARDPSLLDIYLGTMSPDYRRQLRKKVVALIPTVAEIPIRWDRILPEAHPPAQESIVVPGRMPDYLRPLVEEVMTSRGLGKGAHIIHNRDYGKLPEEDRQ